MGHIFLLLFLAPAIRVMLQFSALFVWTDFCSVCHWL